MYPLYAARCAGHSRWPSIGAVVQPPAACLHGCAPPQGAHRAAPARAQEAQGLLQESYRARDALERERDALARRLAHFSSQARGAPAARMSPTTLQPPELVRRMHAAARSSTLLQLSQVDALLRDGFRRARSVLQRGARCRPAPRPWRRLRRLPRAARRPTRSQTGRSRPRQQMRARQRRRTARAPRRAPAPARGWSGGARASAASWRDCPTRRWRCAFEHHLCPFYPTLPSPAVSWGAYWMRRWRCACEWQFVHVCKGA